MLLIRFTILIPLFLFISCQEKEQTYYGEIKDKPIIVNPEDNKRFCNEIPIFEWIPVKYTLEYRIVINDELITTIKANSDLSKNMKYDLGDHFNYVNFINYICPSFKNSQCPFNIAYFMEIHACNDFMCVKSNRVRFSLIDCID